MGALLSLPQSLLNALLPFTNKNTPLYQDLIHTAILCTTLYFAPAVVDFYNTRLINHNPPLSPTLNNPDPDDPTNDIPIDENFVLQDDGDEDVEPPPLAPTPPPGQAEPAQWQNPPLPGEDEAGPANANVNEPPRPTPQNRTIGAKKAKSLARKDQRRAYHEFHRQEAELRRQREAEGKEEREALLAAKKARRAEAEELIREKEREERELRKEEERREQEEERARRERVVVKVRQELSHTGAVNLVELAWAEGKDRLWIERLVRASGLLSQMSDLPQLHTMITEAGWAVRIDANLMRDAYADAVGFSNKNGGKVSFTEFGDILEKAVRARAKAS